MVRGFFFINHLDQFCEGYLLEKHVRKTFSKKVTIRAKKHLKLIHADVCNPIHLNSFCKSEDFFTCH